MDTILWLCFVLTFDRRLCEGRIIDWKMFPSRILKMQIGKSWESAPWILQCAPTPCGMPGSGPSVAPGLLSCWCWLPGLLLQLEDSARIWEVFLSSAVDFRLLFSALFHLLVWSTGISSLLRVFWAVSFMSSPSFEFLVLAVNSVLMRSVCCWNVPF